MTEGHRDDPPPVRRECAHLARRGVDLATLATLVDLTDESEQHGWREAAGVYRGLLVALVTIAWPEETPS